MILKLYVSDDQAEAVVGNFIYDKSQDESTEDFQKRVIDSLVKDYPKEKFQFVLIDVDYLEKFSDNMLTESYRGAKGKLQNKLLTDILTKRGVKLDSVKKSGKVAKEGRTLEEAKNSKEYKEMNLNRNRMISFYPSGKKGVGEKVEGRFKSINFNALNTIMNLNVDCGGKTRGVTEQNPTIEFWDL